MPLTMRSLAVAIVLAMSACAPGASGPQPDPGLQGLALERIRPTTLLPGTAVVLEGESFAQERFGVSSLRLVGELNGSPVDVRLPAEFAEFTEMRLEWPGAAAAGLLSDGVFRGDASVEVQSLVDGETYATQALPIELEVRSTLQPQISAMDNHALIFINEEIQIQGQGFLLGPGEGSTMATVEGCYHAIGAEHCEPITPTAVPMQTLNDARTQAQWVFAPDIVETIQPGRFEGHVTVHNVHGKDGSGPRLFTERHAIEYEVLPSSVSRISPEGASLGQFVEIHGGGFVGAHGASSAGELTLLTLEGQATVQGRGTVPVQLTLIPEFVSGRKLRYALSEEDSLGQALDFRRSTARFVGTARTRTIYNDEALEGEAVSVSLQVNPVKQVVRVDFLPTYVEGLRAFGLRAMDYAIRARVLEVLRRDYKGVNIEFRTAAVEDFAVFSVVEVAGSDPSGAGLLGLDNTPGKDVGNQRLHDEIGGANAVQQPDGQAGYGGVFVESFFTFSERPGEFASRADVADGIFDEVFGSFRPDRGGRPVVATDLSTSLPALNSSRACPGSDRSTRAACAVVTLGNLIGNTVSHEIGHSLGMSNPNDPTLRSVHNVGDAPNRLMDSGAGRPFRERAELDGQGPAVFCDENFRYLQAILPTNEPDPLPNRPACF